MEYENKTNEELIELLEAKDEEINILQENEQNAQELTDEISDYESQVEEHNEALADREQVSEKAYYAGFDDAKNEKLSSIKGWLNFKVEQRI